jgi:hypothetical protein
MTYTYILERKHVEKLGFVFDDKARKYFAIQNGWNGEFQGVFKTTMKDGLRYDYELISGSNMTERQKEFIIKRCESRG